MNVNEQGREDDRAYALIMKTLDTSLGYRLIWALDRLGWRIATQQLDERMFLAPYQSTAQWPHWMEPADRDELKLRVRTMRRATRAVTTRNERPGHERSNHLHRKARKAGVPMAERPLAVSGSSIETPRHASL